MPNPNSLSASGRYIEIDLTAADFPLLFAPLFAEKYPDEIGFQAQAVSRTIVATSVATSVATPSAGEIELIGTRGEATSWTMAEGEANGIQATGISDPGDVESVKVML